MKIASEKEMRAESDALVGNNLTTHLAPFTFALKDGKHTVEIRNKAISYTPDLWQKISDMLSFNDDPERR